MKLPEVNKKNLLFVLAFFAAVAVLVTVIALVGVFARPNNHNESKYGVWRVRMVGWDGDTQHREWAESSLSELNRLGPTFSLVNSGEDVTVVRSELPCAEEAGDFNPTQRVIRIDPVCVAGELEFRTVFIHEVGHSLGMNHICLPSSHRTDCSPVGRGRAVMNPGLRVDSHTDPFDAVDLGTVPTWEVQELDIGEFRRVRGR